MAKSVKIPLRKNVMRLVLQIQILHKKLWYLAYYGWLWLEGQTNRSMESNSDAQETIQTCDLTQW